MSNEAITKAYIDDIFANQDLGKIYDLSILLVKIMATPINFPIINRINDSIYY
jgi:hypothetical protein